MSKTLVAADFHSRNIPNTRGLISLIQQIGRFDPALLSQLLSALSTFNAATTLAEQVKAGLGLLKLAVLLTPSKSDDTIVAVIDSIATPEMLDLVTRLVAGLSSAPTARSLTATTTPAEREMATAKAIPWAFLIQLATQLAALIEQLLKAKPVPPVAPAPPSA